MKISYDPEVGALSITFRETRAQPTVVPKASPLITTAKADLPAWKSSMRKMEPAGSGTTWTGSRMASERFERVKRLGGTAVTQARQREAGLSNHALRRVGRRRHVMSPKRFLIHPS